MSFTSITTGEIASGQPVSSTTQTKIKGNFDDHESRIEALESATIANPPITFRINGGYANKTDVLKTTTNLSLTITGVRLIIDQDGSSGTTEIDILRSRSGGAYTSIFTTKPSVAAGSGNDTISTNGVLDSSMQDFIAGDLLRLDITSSMVAATGFLVRIDYDRV